MEKGKIDEEWQEDNKLGFVRQMVMTLAPGNQRIYQVYCTWGWIQ